MILRRDPFDPGLLDRIRGAAGDLPRQVEVEILAYGDVAVEPLCGLLGDDGWAAIHAAWLLGRLGSPSAVGPLIAAMETCTPLDILYDELIRALGRFGAAAVEPLLAARDASRDAELRTSHSSVLCRTGVRDSRALAALLEELERDPVLGACLLAEYGDPAALPALIRAFDEYELEEPSWPFANQAVVEFTEAIEELGGSLTAEQRAKRAMALEARERGLRPPRVAASRPRPGRNDRCWCGSGKKYKRCHLREDELSLAGGAT